MFEHEQSLVFETKKGLVVFNSCSHIGVDNIISEIKETFPGKKVYTFIGGLHLYKANTMEVEALARRMQALEIENIYTGHCTGEKAYQILKKNLGDKLKQLKTGLIIEL